MKILKIKIVALACCSALLLLSCKSNTENKEDNLENAEEKVTVAREELSEARLDSINEYAKYRADMDAKLIENEKQIAEIRAKNKLQKQAIRSKIDKNLDALMQKNEEFKIEMKSQKDGAYNSWESFKDKFNSDMDDLGKSISKMAEDNKKK